MTICKKHKINVIYPFVKLSQMYLFSMLTITNYHKCGLSKQLKYILFTVLEARCPKSRCWQNDSPSPGSRKNLFLDSPNCWWPQAFLLTKPLHLCLCGHTALSTSVCQTSLCFSLIDILVVGVRAHLNNPG